ncbi:hypothetical protein ACVINI_005880 [Rhizobium beringeri]
MHGRYVGNYPGGEAVVAVIGEFNRLCFGCEGGNAGDWAEDFLIEGPHAGLDPRQHGGSIEATVVGATNQQLRALSRRIFYDRFNARHLIGGGVTGGEV